MMARDVIRSNGLFVVPAVSPALRQLMVHREILPDYGGEEDHFEKAEFRLGPWIPPRWFFDEQWREAKAALEAMERLAAPAPDGRVVDFLNMLWIANKHASDIRWDNVEKVYPRLLRSIPGYCWRPDRLEAAAQAFPWFPGVAELANFHSAEKRWIEGEIAVLRDLVALPVNTPEQYHEHERREAERYEAWKERRVREREQLLAVIRTTPSTTFADKEPASAAYRKAVQEAYKATRDHLEKRRQTDGGQPPDIPDEEKEP